MNKKMREKLDALSEEDKNRIIEMAWEDRTPFDAIWDQLGWREQEVIQLMRRNLAASSWRLWRKRVQGRATKHKAQASDTLQRFKSSRQRAISLNKISKK